MKKLSIFFLALATVFMASVACAGTVALSWNPNAASEQVTGYNIYVDGAKNSTVTTTSATVTVTNGAHSFYVTAVNAWAESAPSATVTTPPLPGAPSGVKYIVTVTITGG